MNPESHEIHTRTSRKEPENELLDCRSDRTMKLSHPDRFRRSLFNSSVHHSRSSLGLHTSVAEDLEHSDIIDGTRSARGETEEQSPIIHPLTYLDGVDFLCFPPLNLRTTKTMRTALLHCTGPSCNPQLLLRSLMRLHSLQCRQSIHFPLEDPADRSQRLCLQTSCDRTTAMLWLDRIRGS